MRFNYETHELEGLFNPDYTYDDRKVVMVEDVSELVQKYEDRLASSYRIINKQRQKRYKVEDRVKAALELLEQALPFLPSDENGLEMEAVHKAIRILKGESNEL